MSSLFYFLFFYSFVEYVHIDSTTYSKAPGPYCGGRGEMAERGLVRLGLCLKTAVLSVCSLVLQCFFLSLCVGLKIDPAGRVVPYVLVRRLVRLQGPSRRLQEVRLFIRAFVLYSPWITGEHCQGTSAVECVAAHPRGFEEDSRSEVVFWIDEWSIESGFTVASSRNKSC